MKFMRRIAIVIVVLFIFNIIPNLVKGRLVQAEGEQFVLSNLHPVMGEGSFRKERMVQAIKKNNSNLSDWYVDNFVNCILKEAKYEGINHDVLYGLMMLETGFLKFGGDVKVNQNNFGGLGATGNGNPGLSFSTVEIGVRAVTQHRSEEHV